MEDNCKSDKTIGPTNTDYNRAAIYLLSILSLMMISYVLFYNINTASAVTAVNSTAKPNQTGGVPGNASTAAVNPSNITSITNSIISNITSTKDFAKIANINVAAISKQAKLSLTAKQTNETKETVIPTRAGYNDTKAYLQAKIGASAVTTPRELTLYTFIPNSTAPSVISTNASSSVAPTAATPTSPSPSPQALRPSSNTTTSGSTQLQPSSASSAALALAGNQGLRPESVKVNMALKDALDITTGCGTLLCSPSDNVVGVGPNHVVQMVNLAGKIWNKTNGMTVQYFALKDFFRTGNHQISDPYIYFDQDSGKWFASLFDVTSESYRISVSRTDDPTGTWSVFNLASFNSCPDQGRFAVNRDLFVISVNDFGPKCTDGFKGVQYTIAAKQDLVSGASTIRSQTQPVNPSLFSVLPVQPLTSTSDMYMASVGDFGTSSVQLLLISGIPPNATTKQTSIPITPSVAPVQAKQPGDSNLLDTADGRISSASHRDGKIWIAFNDLCDQGKTKHDCIRLIQLDVNNLQRPVQDFDIAAKGADVFYPTLSTDIGGNMILAFGISSQSIYPSIMVTTQSPSSALNAIEKPMYLIKGTVAEDSGRYGDYDGSAFDSNVNIWITHQYNKNSSGWSTLVASLSRP